nr:MAG TPA: hypothetical protein [Caudoviricetes sp.]
MRVVVFCRCKSTPIFLSNILCLRDVYCLL